jgi:hypothetical protein
MTIALNSSSAALQLAVAPHHKGSIWRHAVAGSLAALILYVGGVPLTVEI